jgi:hypothetical protein
MNTMTMMWDNGGSSNGGIIVMSPTETHFYFTGGENPAGIVPEQITHLNIIAASEQ